MEQNHSKFHRLCVRIGIDMNLKEYIYNIFIISYTICVWLRVFTRTYYSQQYKTFFNSVCTIVIILMPLGVTLLTIYSALHKLLVYIILKIRVGDDFAGFISGCDVAYSVQAGQQTTINAICSMRTKKSSENFFSELKHRVWETFKRYPVFISARQSCLGYDYYLKQDLQIDDLFTEVNVSENEDLLATLNECCRYEISNRNKAFNAEFIFISTPVDRSKEGAKYLIIFRVDHSVCDGVTMYTTLMKLFNAKVNLTEDHLEKLISAKRQTKLKAVLKGGKFVTYSSFQMKNKSENGRIFAIYAEHKTEYVDKIELIQKTYSVSMTSIITAALNASIAEYFRKNSEKVPKKISWLSPAQVQPNRFSEHVKLLKLHDTLRLGNDYTMRRMLIPLPSNGMSIAEYTEVISQQLNDYNEGLDSEFYYAINRVALGVWPPRLVQYLWSSWIKSTVVYSAVPYGGGMLELQDGSLMEEFYLVANANRDGITVINQIYDRRLNVTISGTESIFNRSELDGILQRMLYHVDALYGETLKLREHNH